MEKKEAGPEEAAAAAEAQEAGKEKEAKGIAVAPWTIARVGDKYLCVVVKVAEDDAFVLTAYLTDSVKVGVIVWPRRS